MKATYILTGLLFAGCTLFSSCEDKLDIAQHGVSTFDNFYKTDADAEEAIVACYSKWKDTYQPAFWIKNLLSDDCYAAGESWTAASANRLSTYTFDSDFSFIKTLYENLYKVIYAANIVLQNVGEDSDVKLRARAEAKVFRAMSYFELISLWGTPPLVDHPLKPDEYSQANGDTGALWALVNQDLTEAANSGALTEKATPDNFTYRITKQFAQALAGKAYLFQKNYSAAATAFDDVINSGKYELYNDFENIQTTKGEANCESLFESNYVYDSNNATGIMSDMIWVYIHWRGDMISFNEPEQVYSHGGWGFFNPTKESYDAFASMGDTYRLNASIKTYGQMEDMGISLSDVIAYMPDNAGFFGWKYRVYEEDVINYWWLRCPNNTRAMRYAEVLLLAAEANVQSGNAGKAAQYVNKVRTRAQLPGLSTVSLDDVKKEKRLELWMEGCRYQDLIRWGDAATVLAGRGRERPALYKDGHVSWDEQKNPAAGFKAGKHELLPFPATEMNVNKNTTQNPGW
jgi:hypothetical protein